MSNRRFTTITMHLTDLLRYNMATQVKVWDNGLDMARHRLYLACRVSCITHDYYTFLPREVVGDEAMYET